MTPPDELPHPAYETSDARVGWVLAGIGLLVVGLMLSFATVAGLYHRVPRANNPLGSERLFQHGAVAESGIAQDWKAQEAAVRRHLDTYAWVDRAGGFVQIPIARAMELAAQDAASPEKNHP